MKPEVRSVFDVAVWYHKRAKEDWQTLQPRVLQILLYLSQAHFAGTNQGARLIPSIFVTGQFGPIEPNSYYAFENGVPRNLTAEDPNPHVQQFLDVIWRKYAHHQVEHLLKLIKKDTIYVQAMGEGIGTEIPLSAMAKAYRLSPPKENVDTNRYTPDGKKVGQWKPSRQASKPSLQAQLQQEAAAPKARPAPKPGQRTLTNQEGEVKAVKAWMPVQKKK